MTQAERKQVYIDKIKNRLNSLSLETLMKIYNYMTYKD